MNSFFVLNSTTSLSVSEQYAGCVIFYKKSKEADVAAIQANLFSKLIENALKLSLDNFLFIDISDRKERFSKIRKEMDVKKCFLFGVNEIEVGINFDIPSYELITISDIEFLKTDAAEVLEREKHLKNKLWVQLQISFKLS